MLKEFKEFVMRGNVMDMAVGIIIGAAFGAIVTSLVNDVIMPPVGLLLGGVDFSSLFVLLKAGAKAAPPYASVAEAKAAGAVTVNLGPVHQRGHQLPDRRVRRVHGGEGGQQGPPRRAAAARPADAVRDAARRDPRPAQEAGVVRAPRPVHVRATGVPWRALPPQSPSPFLAGAVRRSSSIRWISSATRCG